MIKIRKNVFETNSSSMHSLILHNRKATYNLPVEEDGYIHVELGEYGWGYKKLRVLYDRLAYALAMVMETEGGVSHWGENSNILGEQFYNSDGFNAINELIKKKYNCNGIKIDSNGDEYYPYGYIDHQSYEDYNSLQDFLDDWGVTLEEFLFNENVVVIDNDNH